jgi:hypothetical protein
MNRGGRRNPKHQTNSPKHEPGVVAQSISHNKKLSPVDFALAPGASRKRPAARKPFCCSIIVSIRVFCPDSCAYKGQGCFASSGFLRRQSEQLNASAPLSKVGLAQAEFRAIRRLFNGGPVPQDGARGGRDLRLHVGGDAANEEHARALKRAAADWSHRGGGAVWTYTHRWREIPREAWGGVSVLASVETPAEAAEAMQLGYAAAITVEEFKQDKPYRVSPAPTRFYQDPAVTVIPCPAEVRGKTCVECRLCLDADGLLKRNQVIGFALHGHGNDLRKARAALGEKVPRQLPFSKESSDAAER